MPRRKSLGQYESFVVKTGDKLGWLVDDLCDPSDMGKADRKRVYWRLDKCQNPRHVTLVAPRTVAASKGSSLICLHCTGVAKSDDPEGERHLRDLIHIIAGYQVMAFHVHPWDETQRSADIFLPACNVVIFHDGRSHFDAPMPRDRAASAGPKILAEIEWGREASRKLFKVVRLHYADEQWYGDLIETALADVAIFNDFQPVYSPSYKKYLTPCPT